MLHQWKLFCCNTSVKFCDRQQQLPTQSAVSLVFRLRADPERLRAGAEPHRVGAELLRVGTEPLRVGAERLRAGARPELPLTVQL